MHPRLSSALLLGPALLLSSCATIFSGTHDEVEVKISDPEARLVIDGKPLGNGTQVVDLTKYEDHIIEVIPTKGAPRRVNLSPTPNILVLLNAIIPGGTIATLIDCLTGAAFNLSDDSVEFDFSRPDGSQYGE